MIKFIMNIVIDLFALRRKSYLSFALDQGSRLSLGLAFFAVTVLAVILVRVNCKPVYVLYVIHLYIASIDDSLTMFSTAITLTMYSPFLRIFPCLSMLFYFYNHRCCPWLGLSISLLAGSSASYTYDFAVGSTGGTNPSSATERKQQQCETQRQ